MKKFRNLSILLTLILSVFYFGLPTNITTESKKYASSNSSEVSTRELAMLASLVYEDVPSAKKYVDGTGACIDVDGKLQPDCNFTAENKLYALKGTNYKAYRYVEGMSERKMYSIVTSLGQMLKEDGEFYIFQKFAHTKELENWKIFDYRSTRDENQSFDDVNIENAFDSIVFKKGDNYVISVRGTDFPDLAEWITDIVYAFDGTNSQTEEAYKYAQKVYEKIKDEDPNGNAKIYVTGHSLGGYLAQVMGAAIVDYEAGRNINSENLTTSSINDYGITYSPKNGKSRLVQLGYFNGMGVTSIVAPAKQTINIENALVYLSAYDRNGSLANGDRTVNYTDKIKSSGRLVLYSMDSDPVSAIGFHYGEIYKFDPAADAITNHKGEHTISISEILNSEKTNKAANNLIKELSNKIKNKLDGVSNTSREQVFESIYNYISKAVSSIGTNSLSDNNYVPKFVKEQIGNDKFSKFDMKVRVIDSLLIPIIHSYKNFTGENFDDSVFLTNGDFKFENIATALSQLITYANINHETDSFTCLIDKEHGSLKDLKEEDFTLDVSGYGIYGSGKNFTLKSDYSESKIYVLNNPIPTRGYGEKYITLKADIDGGCAKKYNWYYIIKDAQENEIKNKTVFAITTRNDVMVPESFLSNINPGTYNVTFGVDVSYGDVYEVAKMNINENGSISYSRTGNAYEVNPTLNDELPNSNTPVLKTRSEINLPVAFSKEKEVVLNYKLDEVSTPIDEQNNNYNITYTVKSNKANCELNNGAYVCYSNVSFDDIDDIEISFSGINGDIKAFYAKQSDGESNVEEMEIIDNKIKINSDMISLVENSADTLLFILKDAANDTIVKEFTVYFVYDTKAPTCEFSSQRVYKEIWYAGWFKYDPVSFSINLVCNDNYENVVNSGLEKTKNISLITKYQNIFVDLFTSDLTYKLGYGTYEENNKKLTQKIQFTAKKPVDVGSKVIYKEGIKDKAGNEFKPNIDKAPSFDVEIKKRS